MKSVSVIAGASILAAALLAAAPARADGEKILLSFSSLKYPVFVFTRGVAENEAKKLNINLIVTDGQASSPTQSSDIRSAIVEGVKGAIILPNDVNALTPAVDEMLDAGIPVLTVDRRLESPSKPVFHSGTDNVAGGKAIAEYIIQTFPKGASIVLLTGQPGSSPAIDRAKGVKDRLASAGPSYKIVAEQTANWMRDEGLSVTQSILMGLSTPPDVIIGSNDDMALGALEALKTADAKAKKIAVIGFDAIPEALASIKQGALTATVDQANDKQMSNAIEMLVDNIRNGAKMQDISTTPFVVARANLDKASRIGELAKWRRKGSIRQTPPLG
jgi:inositol transport system substrate-binding protein